MKLYFMKYTGFAYMFFISANLSDYIFMNKHKKLE
jgi:hypothetical protein